MLFALSKERATVDDDETCNKTDTDIAVVNENFPENSVVTVSIGSSQKQFSVKALSQLAYFKARFATRWRENNDNNNKNDVIEILPSNCNDTNDDQFNYNQIQFKFDCDDLQLLLEGCQESGIPYDACLELKQLEALLYCHDYLNPQSDAQSLVINKSVLMSYFRNRVPPLHKEKRDEFLSDCTHPMLLNALQTLECEYDKIFEESQENLFVKVNSSSNIGYSYNYIKSLLDSVTLDGKTATKLFESQFELVADFQINSNSRSNTINIVQRQHGEKLVANICQHHTLFIGIKNFKDSYPRENSKDIGKSNDNNTTSSILSDLWDLAEKGKYCSASTFEKISDLIEKILNSRINDCQIVGFVHQGSSAIPPATVREIEQHQITMMIDILSSLLFQMMDLKLMDYDRRLRNAKHISISSLIQAIIMITSRAMPRTAFAREQCTDAPEFLNMTQNEMLVSLICQMTSKYFPRCMIGNHCLTNLRVCTSSLNNWMRLLTNSLLRCSSSFIVRETPQWFPMLHDKPRKWLIKAAEGLRQSDQYKSSVDPHNSDNDDNDDNDNDDDNEDDNQDNNDNDNDNDNDSNNIGSNDNDSSQNCNSNSDYFDDAMIEEIVQLENDLETKIAEWITSELIVSTDECFEFGIYLSKYIVFENKNKNYNEPKTPFPQLYVDFMKKHCGISWKLV